MSLLAALLIGILIGGVGGFLLRENFDLLAFNILMGIAGSILGGAVYFFTDSAGGYLSFSWADVLFSVVGALIFVMLINFAHRTTPEKIAHEEHTPED